MAKLSKEQLQYAKHRLDVAWTTENTRIAALCITKNKRLTAQEVQSLIVRKGKLLAKTLPAAQAISTSHVCIDALFDIPELTTPATTVDCVKMARMQAALNKRFDAAMDQLMLGDDTTALKLVQLHSENGFDVAKLHLDYTT